MIVIVDYHMGNVGSIKNMIKKLGSDSVISSDPTTIRNAGKLILPGVGAFDNGMENINKLNLLDILNEKVLQKRTPILGICLGMELITKSSEEGIREGLGWIDASTVKFKFLDNVENLKVPHMGWNTIQIKKQSRILLNMRENPRFYFVHSYHPVCNNVKDVVAETTYGYPFTSIFAHKNIVGVQFHPEKSHKYGMKLLQNFIEM